MGARPVVLGDPGGALSLLLVEEEREAEAAWGVLAEAGTVAVAVVGPGVSIERVAAVAAAGKWILLAMRGDDLGDGRAEALAGALRGLGVSEDRLRRLRPELEGVAGAGVDDLVSDARRRRRDPLEALKEAINAAPIVTSVNGHAPVASAPEARRAPAVSGDRSAPQADVVIAANVKPERVVWLWDYRIGCGKLTVITGDPDTGKSTVTLDVAARVTRGARMPDGTAGLDRSRYVLVMGAAEDGLADTILPRLIAGGADTSRVVVLRGIREGSGERRMFEAPRDLPVLAELIARYDIALVVVDALMAVLPGKIDSHRDQDIRLALHPLATLAEETGAAVVFIRHTIKQPGSRAIDRGAGSRAVGAVARSEMLVTRDPEDPHRRLVALVKNNVAPETEKSRTFTYETVGALVDDPDGGPPIETSRIEWGETIEVTADAALAASDGRGGAGDDEADADDVLLGVLEQGPLRGEQFERAVRGSGVSRHVFEQRRSHLRKTGRLVRWQEPRPGGGAEAWWWHLPHHTPPGGQRGSVVGEVCKPNSEEGSRGDEGHTSLSSRNQGSVPAGEPPAADLDRWERLAADGEEGT